MFQAKLVPACNSIVYTGVYYFSIG
jgi:hypothetical protein